MTPHIFIDRCTVDGTDLVEVYEGEPPQVWFRCVGSDEHTFQAAWDDLQWSPIDSHSYDS